MANIPGISGTVLPGTIVNVTTLSRGASVPGGIRVASIIGQGAASQTIISSALGGGQDGLDPTYTTTTGQDGRHFTLAAAPVIQNRTSLFKNGIPLVVLESTITTTTTFSNIYDAQLDINTGHILLQSAYLVDQGGTFYSASTSNVGIGVINGLTLVDAEAPTETWTIKCVSVQHNNMNQPIAGTAIFTAIGTVSGNVRNANGVTTTWIANNTVASNGILSFSIQETAGTPFEPGDSFTVGVKSGVLNHNDSLTASYIPTGNLNSPIFLQSMTDITNMFGPTSLSNNLSLGCQLAFANGGPGIMCVQAAPPLPRRTSYVLDTSVNALSLNPEEFIFTLPLGVVPDPNSQIHFFVTNPTTAVETQLLPNKFPFYTLGTSGQPSTSTFIFDNNLAPAGNSFSYSVIQNFETLVSAADGYFELTPGTTTPYTHGTFSSGSFTFTSSYVGKVLNILESNDVANVGQWVVNAVQNGQLLVQLIQPLSVTNDPPTIPASITLATVFPDFVTSGTTPPNAIEGTPEASTETFALVNPNTGLVVTGSSGTDGFLTANVGTGTATFHSTAINFGSFGGSPVTLGYQLKVTTPANAPTSYGYNNGQYIITGYNNSTNTLTIAKCAATDSGIEYEVLDTTVPATNYVVVNHNVVPNNNQLRVTIVDARDAAFFDAGWLNALTALQTQEIDILVPLPNQTISVIFQNALNHCLTMSNELNKRERVLFIGAINGLSPANLTGAQLAAVESIGVLEGIHGNTVAEILAGDTEDLANYSVSNAYGNTYRAVYFYPDQIVVQVGTQNSIIDGFYIAAAAAGYLSGNNNIAVPLTNKILSGLTILRNKQFSPLTLTQLASAGVTVLQPVTGGGNVVWGITTSQSGFVEEQEISIVFIRDRIAKSLRSGFDDFVGFPIDDTMLAKLTARALAMLNGFIAEGLISQFADLIVEVDPVDPTQIDISVKVQPVYPLNFIYISVSVGLL
jgi:tail sheath protein